CCSCLQSDPQVLPTHASSSPVLCREVAAPPATWLPVCSLSAADSKCIRMMLDYTDGDGIARLPSPGEKSASQLSIFAGARNRPPEEKRHDHQTSILGRNSAWLCDVGGRRADRSARPAGRGRCGPCHRQ